MTDFTGQQVGQYHLLRKLGEGGMGQVYLARQEVMGREVAIKFVVDRAASIPEFVERFEREVRVCASLNHAHIIKVFDYNKARNRAAGYLVMEYLKGGSLTDLIRKKNPLPLDIVTRLLEQIASALDYAHGKGIIHRDLKPLNVLLDEGGNAYISDFGLAKLKSASTLTQTGTAMGTPYYMPPEEWKGKPALDHRADIYSLGVILFEMLTGCVPFDAESSASIIDIIGNRIK
jgi:serine/threonine-protein kinase